LPPTRTAIEPETTPDGTSDAYLWKTRRPAIPKASPRELAVAARSALGHSSLHSGVAARILVGRTSRLAVVNALQDQLGMRSGQVETGWTSVDVGWVSTSAEGSAASAPF
jgi:hypothetical protein